MSNSNIFVVKNPPQYGVITSKLEKNKNGFDDTLFPSVYNGCEDSVNKIIEHNKKMDSQDNPDIEPFVNPIVAITGSRGSGKSSAMYSYAQYLKDATISGATFSILPPIDATQFGKNESNIGNISAAMYREYGKISDKLSVDKKREFVKAAKEVNNIAVMYTTGDWFKSGDDLLQDAEMVGSLRKRLHDLIMIYLGLYTDNQSTQKSCQNRYLVIMIDDLDMCNDGAFALVEEIRKFLCIRNVIILMTMQSSQLRTVLQASYAKAFKDVGSDMKEKIQGISFDLAFRSFEKLFPASRCHAMPVWNSEQLKNYELRIEGESKDERKDKGKKDTDIIDIYGENIENPEDLLFGKIPKFETRSKILYRTLHLIWRKTLLIPVCSKDGEHLLIPNNLRSLHNFIALFVGMEDAIQIRDKNKPLPPFVPGLEDFENFVLEDYINKNVLEKNLALFETYLLDNLSTYGDTLITSSDNQTLAQTLLNIILDMHSVPLERLNAKIIGDVLYSNLPEYVLKALKNKTVNTYNFELNKMDKDDLPNSIDDEKGILQSAVSYADNISFGDVMYVLGKIDVKTRCRYIAYLIEVIRIMWSIRMTKEFYIHCTYDKKQSTLYISDTFQKVVGGLIINANTTTFTESNENHDWYKYREEFAIYDKMFVGSSIDSFLAENTPLAKYRHHLKDGEPYYKLTTGNEIRICHPMSYYTKSLGGLWKQVVYFPFYSFDFMYRFYEEFRKKCREKPIQKSPDHLENNFERLDESKCNAMGEQLDVLRNYIPFWSEFKQCNADVNIYYYIRSKCFAKTNAILKIDNAISTADKANEYLAKANLFLHLVNKQLNKETPVISNINAHNADKLYVEGLREDLEQIVNCLDPKNETASDPEDKNKLIEKLNKSIFEKQEQYFSKYQSFK